MEGYKKYPSSAREAIMVMAKNAVGEYGKEVLATGNLSSTTGVYFRQLMVVADAIFTAITDEEAMVTAGDPPVTVDQAHLYLEDVEIMAGTTIYGMFKDITISQGVVVCYKEAPGGAGIDPGY